MRRCALFCAVVLFALVMAGYCSAQDKPKKGGDEEGRIQEDGSIIMPEPAPPRGKQAVTSEFMVDITSVIVRETATGPTFSAKGISRFPDGTMALVQARFYEVVLPGGSTLVEVKDGRWEATFEASKLWGGRKYFPGNYEVEVEINPRLQASKVRKKIKEKLGAMGQTKAYRNYYVTVGTKERMKQEEDRLREYYIGAITGTQKLFTELKAKFRAAKVKYTREFFKRDKDGKAEIDKDNSNAYVVDDAKFRKHLREEPNEFYDRTGQFLEEAWRSWLDSVWRAEWKGLVASHKRIKGDYAVIAWPRQYDEMETALKMLMKRSAENSISLYKWANLSLSKKDTDLAGVGDFPEWPTKTSENDIKRLILSVGYKLRIGEYRKRKEEEEKKNK